MIPGSGRSPGEGKVYPLQYSGLENSKDCVVHGVTESWTQLSNLHCTALSKTYRCLYVLPTRHKLESRLLEEISITSDRQMTPPLWQKVKKN